MRAARGLLLLLALAARLRASAADGTARPATNDDAAEHQIDPVLPGTRVEDSPADVPDDATLEANGAVIGAIEIKVRDIFDLDDPSEDRLVFRAANRLHRRTREGVVLHQLTFREGEPYSRAKLDESERLLRKNGYLYDAAIRPVRYVGNQVDVEVVTRDVWTLKGGFGFGRSGGVNKTRIGLHDSNFLGFGKDLEIQRSSNVDRTETTYSYTDRNLLGSHGQLELVYADNSDGSGRLLRVERPFWSLDSRWALGVRAESSDCIDSLYELGTITDVFRHRADSLVAYGGWSRGAVGRKTRRFSVGLTLENDRFETGADLPTTSFVPPDRKLAYPWFGYDVAVDGYVRTRDLDKIGRTEDLNLGRELHARVGWSAPAFGADRSAAVVDVDYRAGFTPGFAQTLLLSAGLSGRWGQDGVENGIADASVRYYRRSPSGLVFFAGLTGRAASHLDLDRQILLGGDTGLRGYPLRYAVGNRATLFTVEERFYGSRERFKLFHIGAAIFADVGQVSGGSAGPGSDLDVLRDVGVGLRIGQSRSAHASLVKVDLAFPLDGDPTMKRLQLLVTTGERF